MSVIKYEVNTFFCHLIAKSILQDSSQKDHFYRLYETVKALDKDSLANISFEEFYVPFGRITNMSTRKGKVEFLSDLINEAKLVAHESMEFSKSTIFFDLF